MPHSPSCVSGSWGVGPNAAGVHSWGSSYKNFYRELRSKDDRWSNRSVRWSSRPILEPIHSDGLEISDLEIHLFECCLSIDDQLNRVRR